MENKSQVLVVGGDTHLREIEMMRRMLESIDTGILEIPCETVEVTREGVFERLLRIRKEDEELLTLEITRMGEDPTEDHYPIEPKPRFSDRWKGGTGPGATAPIRRGRKR